MAAPARVEAEKMPITVALLLREVMFVMNAIAVRVNMPNPTPDRTGYSMRSRILNVAPD